jgi:hypothetical protein
MVLARLMHGCAANITEAEYHEFARVLAALHHGLAAIADEPPPLAPDALAEAPPLLRGTGQAVRPLRSRASKAS